MALELTSAERQSYLDAACAGDPLLRAEVSRLLDPSPHAADFLDQPAAVYAGPFIRDVDEEPTPSAGALVGPYRIVGEAGHGGMGTVYLAERADDQYRKRVAVKLVRAGLSLDDHLIRRFREERQILASLDHPGIAKLLDGGITAEGLPWFAMEYVEGRPIDRYAVEAGLSIEARLRLFLEVCEAVQYAHRNLVIHRDLKPSNILVSESGEVKLLDFGIAKMVGPGAEAITQSGVPAMTPEYASPEQLRGKTIGVGSDVYSLGILLYELLSGERPYRATNRDPLELARAILEQDPAPPSERVSPSVRRRLRGDLDTIVGMVLRKEPERRYPTVELLAGDIRRHLQGLPVTAQADSWTYRARKFVGRHTAGVAAALIVLVALTVGLGTALWQGRVASREAAKEREVRNFLVGLFKVSAPDQSRGQEISARELLDRGARRVDSALAGQPIILSELLGVLGEIHLELGLLPKADTLLRRSVELARGQGGGSEMVVAERLAALSEVLLQEAQVEPADSILQQVLAIRRRQMGENDSSVAATLGLLASVQWRQGHYVAAESLHRAALAIDRRLLGNNHAVVAEELNDLGVVLSDARRLASADSAFEDAIAIQRKVLSPDNPELLISFHNLANLRLRQGDLPAAERLYRQVLETRRRVYPKGHPLMATDLADLGDLLLQAGKREEAKANYVEALAMRRALLGPDHPETINALNSLGILGYFNGAFAEAEHDMREVLANWRHTLGDEHPNTLMATNNLAAILRDQGKYRESEAMMQQLLATRRRVLGNHPDVAQSLQNLGLLYRQTGRTTEAERALREALEIDRRALPPGNPLTAGILMELGAVLVDRGRATEAEPLLRESLATWIEKTGATSPKAAQAQQLLGSCLTRLGKYREAEPLLLASHATTSPRTDYWGVKRTGDVRRSLVALYQSWGKPAEARKYRHMPKNRPAN
ncbi:MAG TPA: serine/threonine-protein kinase [Gemmatimonadales bacterium]